MLGRGDGSPVYDPFGPEEYSQGRAEAGLLHARLEQGERLPTNRPSGIVLQPDEGALKETVALYYRHFELRVQYPVRPPVFVMGSPGVMAGATIAMALCDAADRRAARRLAAMAAPQWRFRGFPG
jgi:hypothetical protein